jgi:hypothetical protein
MKSFILSLVIAIVSAGSLNADECTSGTCRATPVRTAVSSIVKAKPIRTVVRGVVQARPLRTAVWRFNRARPVRRVFTGLFRSRSCCN